MTCIVAVEHDGQVWMAGDSCLCLGKNEWDTIRQPKVRVVSGLVLGVAGDLRGLNLVMTWRPPPYPKEVRAYPWLVREFVPRMLQDWKAQTIGDSPPKVDLLIGVAGELYHVDGDGAVYRRRSGFAALGTGPGAAAALGVLGGGGWSTPKRRLEAALTAAARVSPWCRPPWCVVRA